MKSLILSAVLASTANAAAIFTAPAGCTAIAPSLNVTGVQCFGSYTDDASPLAPIHVIFSGGGNGPLWASSITFEWDLTSSSLISRVTSISAIVNGAVTVETYQGFNSATRLTGSANIPAVHGDPLDSWIISILVGTATPDGSKWLDIPTSGVGVRLLVTHDPPVAAVPEPATAIPIGLAMIALGLSGFRRR